jgi:sugar phosphate isomerase/epimerase
MDSPLAHPHATILNPLVRISPSIFSEVDSMNASLLLSGFADEAAIQKTAVEQCAAFAALGLRYLSLRFIDVGGGVKNAMQLTDEEVSRLLMYLGDYGLAVSSLGSPIGKVKLLDIDDGTTNRFVPFDRYLKEDVVRACELATRLNTKLVRGFSFYHPKGTDPRGHMSQAIEQLRAIAETCDRYGLTFGLEVEANLIGQTGKLVGELAGRVNHGALMTIFDGANLVCQGMMADEVFDEYRAMLPTLGWIHVKDYRHPSGIQRTTHVDEEALKNFVPVDRGDSGHEAIFTDLKTKIASLETKLKARRIDGVFCDLEPHVKGGGQFGGFSGPDGFGVALRALCKMLDTVGIGYSLRDYDDLA